MKWIATVAVGVVSSLLATAYYNSIAEGQYLVAGILTLCVVVLTLATALIQVVVSLRSARVPASELGVAVLRGSSRLRASDVLAAATSELDFLGIIAKRTVNSDAFKALVQRSRGEAVAIRFLLLDPDSPVFAERARDERESLEGWRKDLESTLVRLGHFRQTYGIDIQVRFYSVYPMWRLVRADRKLIIANAFLPGRRGTESDQLVCRDESTQWGMMFRAHFEAIWRFHSREAHSEGDIVRK